MAKLKIPNRPDITINGNVATWPISMSGDVQGLYTGTFTFRCFLLPTQRLSASREYRQLLGDHPATASQQDDDTAFALSQLRHRILTCPPFWSNAEEGIPDDNVIMTILQAAVDSELIFKHNAKKKRVDALEKALATSKALLKKQADADKGGDSEEEA